MKRILITLLCTALLLGSMCSAALALTPNANSDDNPVFLSTIYGSAKSREIIRALGGTLPEGVIVIESKDNPLVIADSRIPLPAGTKAPATPEPTPEIVETEYTVDEALALANRAIDGHWDSTIYGDFTDAYQKANVITPYAVLRALADSRGNISQSVLDIFIAQMLEFAKNPTAAY